MKYNYDFMDMYLCSYTDDIKQVVSENYINEMVYENTQIEYTKNEKPVYDLLRLVSYLGETTIVLPRLKSKFNFNPDYINLYLSDYDANIEHKKYPHFDFSDTYYNMGEYQKWEVCYGKVYLSDNSKYKKLYHKRIALQIEQESKANHRRIPCYYVVSDISGELTETAIQAMIEKSFYYACGAVKNKYRKVYSNSQENFWYKMYLDILRVGRKRSIDGYRNNQLDSVNAKYQRISKGRGYKLIKKLVRDNADNVVFVDGKPLYRTVKIPVPKTGKLHLTEQGKRDMQEYKVTANTFTCLNSEDLLSVATLAMYENCVPVSDFDGIDFIRNNVFSAINHYIFEQSSINSVMQEINSDASDENSISDDKREEMGIICENLQTIEIQDIVHAIAKYTFGQTRVKNEKLWHSIVFGYFFPELNVSGKEIASMCSVSEKVVSTTKKKFLEILYADETVSHMRKWLQGMC